MLNDLPAQKRLTRAELEKLLGPQIVIAGVGVVKLVLGKNGKLRLHYVGASDAISHRYTRHLEKNGKVNELMWLLDQSTLIFPFKFSSRD